MRQRLSLKLSLILLETRTLYVRNIMFIARFHFMASSLEKLVEHLYEKADKDINLKHIKSTYGDNMVLLCRFVVYE